MDGSPTGSAFLGFPWKEYWSELPFPSPRDLPNPGIEPMSPASAGEFFTTKPPEMVGWHHRLNGHESE